MLGRQCFDNDERLHNSAAGTIRRHPVAFRELSNIPPLSRSCQEGSDAISLNSAPYAGPAIAFCDGSGIHGDADRGNLDSAEKNEMSSHLLVFKVR